MPRTSANKKPRNGAKHSSQRRGPLISVIIPAYNSAAYLPASVSSVLEQTFRDLEIIVVDDGSTDDTRKALEPFVDRIRYVHQDNGGNAAARNRGLAESQGQWICFLDADDLWEPRKLELQLNRVLSRPGCKVCFTAAHEYYESGELRPNPPGPPPEELWDRMVFYQPFGSSHSGLMAHRSCFEKVGGFDERLRQSVDWDLFIRLARHYRIENLPEYLVLHRQHGRNITRDSRTRLGMYLRCLAKHRDLFCHELGLYREWHESYGRRLKHLGRFLLKQRRYNQAVPYLLRSMRYGGRRDVLDKLVLLIECAVRSWSAR